MLHHSTAIGLIQHRAILDLNGRIKGRLIRWFRHTPTPIPKKTPPFGAISIISSTCRQKRKSTRRPRQPRRPRKLSSRTRARPRRLLLHSRDDAPYVSSCTKPTIAHNAQSIDRYKGFMAFKKSDTEPHPTTDHAKDARTSKPGFWSKYDPSCLRPLEQG
jgi:hypothetical protein